MNRLKENVLLKISQKEFKIPFFKMVALYVILFLLDFFIVGTIGGLSGFFSFILIILFGRSLYKNRQAMRDETIKIFWYFMVSYLIVVSIFYQWLLSIVENFTMIFGLFLILNISFWIYFFLFWSKEKNVPLRSLVYISIVTLSSVLISLVALVATLIY